jgi:hypothetical protein
VAQCAGALESEIRAGTAAPASMARCAAELAAVIGHLQQALRASDAGGAAVRTSPPADPRQVKDVLSRLTALIADNDGAALDCLNDNAEVLRSVLHGGEFSAIEKTLNDFDFEAALEKVGAAAVRLQVTATVPAGQGDGEHG